GHTILDNLPIWPPVWQALQETAQLAAASLVVVALFSLLIGTVAARWPGSILDLLLRGFGYLTWSIPVFLMALGLREILLRLGVQHGFSPVNLEGPPGGAGAG